jgi:hypothetical protein
MVAGADAGRICVSYPMVKSGSAARRQGASKSVFIADSWRSRFKIFDVVSTSTGGT